MSLFLSTLPRNFKVRCHLKDGSHLRGRFWVFSLLTNGFISFFVLEGKEIAIKRRMLAGGVNKSVNAGSFFNLSIEFFDCLRS